MDNLIPTLSSLIETKFWARVNISKEDDCWLWKLKISSELDRPKFYLEGKYYYAARVAYTLSYKEQPGNKLVCHTCDNPKCMNPKHLFLGSVSDNNKDKENKGRGNHPLKNDSRRLLTKSQADEIIRLRHQGYKINQLATMFNVKDWNIKDILYKPIYEH